MMYALEKNIVISFIFSTSYTEFPAVFMLT